MTTTTRQTSRFSGRCETCIYPVVVERADVFGDKLTVACPGCSTTLRLERLYGVYSDTNCDARCQYALGSMCQCACGGANHQSGYIAPVLTGEVPASTIDRYRRTYLKRKEAAKVRSQAKRDAKAQAIADAAEDFLMALEPVAQQALTVDADLSVFPGLDDYAVSTISDIAGKLHSYGSLSDRQVDFVLSLIDRGVQRAKVAAERAAEVKVDAPTGRVSFTGTVVNRKWRDDNYGGAYKLTVRVVTDAGVYRVWVTEPSKVEFSVGEMVTMTATLTRSNDDPSFAFGKRPTVK